MDVFFVAGAEQGGHFGTYMDASLVGRVGQTRVRDTHTGALICILIWTLTWIDLELVDSTGRVIREDKRGFIPGEAPRILERLNIDPEQFIATAARMLQQFSTAIGTPEHLTAHRVARNVAFLRGMGAARALFERKAA